MSARPLTSSFLYLSESTTIEQADQRFFRLAVELFQNTRVLIVEYYDPNLLVHLHAIDEQFRVLQPVSGENVTGIYIEDKSLRKHLLLAIDREKNIRVNRTNEPDSLIMPVFREGILLRLVSISGLPKPSEKQFIRLFKMYRNVIKNLFMAYTDSLTGLNNRKRFDAFSDNIKSSANYFIALIDIDFFKSINDEYGHLMGDEVLIHFGRLLTHTFFDADFTGRYGGEEFVVIYRFNFSKQMKNRLDLFIRRVAGYSFPVKRRVTASAGFTRLSNREALLQAIERADKALYMAKEQGRNRVIEFDHNTMQAQDLFSESEVSFFD